MVCSDADLRVIEKLRRIDHSNVFEIVEKDECAELSLVRLRCRRQHHIELPGCRSLQQDAVIGHHPPNEAGAIEALDSTGAPNIRASEILDDGGLNAFKETRTA